MSQLILTLDDDLVQEAQAYALRHGQQLEALVARLLTDAVRPSAGTPSSQPTPELSPRIQRLLGAVKVPADFDYKKVLEEAIQERYGS